jgi:hypothetical protein
MLLILCAAASGIPRQADQKCGCEDVWLSQLVSKIHQPLKPTMELAEVYELESKICQAKLVNHEGRAQQVSEELWLKMQQDPRTKFPFAKVQADVWQAEISVDVITAVFKTNEQEMVEEIDGRENEYKSYVEKLLDVDLSKVKISRTKNDCKHAEGSALPCGATDHMVLLPPIGADFVSPDLLIHELGHTAEFTLRRASDEIEMVRSHKLFSRALKISSSPSVSSLLEKNRH